MVREKRLQNINVIIGERPNMYDPTPFIQWAADKWNVISADLYELAKKGFIDESSMDFKWQTNGPPEPRPLNMQAPVLRGCELITNHIWSGK